MHLALTPLLAGLLVSAGAAWVVSGVNLAIGARRGLGLGLYLAQRNVQRLQGRLSAASAGPDQGATFTATIPLAPLPSATESGPDT